MAGSTQPSLREPGWGCTELSVYRLAAHLCVSACVCVCSWRGGSSYCDALTPPPPPPLPLPLPTDGAARAGCTWHGSGSSLRRQGAAWCSSGWRRWRSWLAMTWQSTARVRAGKEAVRRQSALIAYVQVPCLLPLVRCLWRRLGSARRQWREVPIVYVQVQVWVRCICLGTARCTQ